MSTVGISVVIPTFNRVAELARAIDSVETAFPDATEIVVVDDASPATSIADLPAANTSGVRVRAYRLPRNQGPQAARNLGVRRARFPFVAFLDSDDAFCNGKLDVIRGVLASDDVDLVYHNVEGLPRYGAISRAWWTRWRRVLPFDWLIVLLNPVATPALTIRRSRALGVPRFRHAEDWAFLLRYVRPDTRVVFIDQPLSRVHRPLGSAGGESAALWRMRRGEFAARRVLLRKPSVTNLAKFAVGSAVGGVRIAADLVRGRYRRTVR